MYLGKNSRQKRELLDGLSVVLKWLIGTPDAKDAMHYEDCINQLEKRETDLSSLMLEQTQIISSTVKTFNESILKITYDELIINENIERLNNYLNSSQSLLFSLKASQDVSAISLQILESVVNLENEINECLTSILFAKSNTIHPSIITLEKLYKELLLSNHIRTNKHLVSPLAHKNIHTILESSSLSAYVYSDKLVYILTFPLIQNDPLDLYHVYSIPIKHPNSSLHTTILPEHVYLAANPSGQTYVSTSSLETCKTYASEKQVCTGLVAYDATARPLCELQILHSISKSLPKICTTSTFEADINTFQYIENNKWLYILSGETNCVLQCTKEVTHHKIQGAGILSLQKNCKLHTGYSTLSASQDSEENITYPIIVPDIRTDDCFEEYRDIAKPDLMPIKINELPLDSLKQIKNHIDKYGEEIKKIKSTTFAQRNTTTFSWVYFTLGLIMLAYLVFKICKRCPNGLLLRRRTLNSPNRDSNGCIQIFNNCFANSSRQQRTHVAIPMSTISTSCVTEDEDEDIEPQHSQPISPVSIVPATSKRSGANAQSLF
ncbi:LOW QUALITY PROTEIN: uncharacterized protein LOC133527864 [Cydia pomonella]|uniref:LOW QUALITY PROTEIN: uncharacterized protein LOC133527864 n=1 Tax=Cydia pomonella TaxID=82600 RepID=UPI002ADD45A1|nr:LOW QUALITY PROTEIN: uncharacterized protein LOC133527864 [Cydia pomonella]